MRYLVEFVDNEALPAEVDWAFAQTVDGDALLFMKRSRVTAGALTDAWLTWERRRARLLAAVA